MLRAALLALLAGAVAAPAAVPPRLVDVDGNAIELRSLAGESRLFLVTMKSASCPVCAEQLVRLERARASLEACGARFLVLSPGPAQEIRAVRRTTRFAAPFVEDVDLRTAQGLDLVLAPGEIVPAIVEVDADGRVLWQQRGRNERLYGDAALRRRLDCAAHDA